MRSRNFLLFGLIIGLVAILGISRLFAKPYQYQGSLIDPPLLAEDFTLTDQNNKAFTLSEQRGKVVLLFFGYTNCPDVCPTTLANYKNIIDKLGGQSSDVRFVFITVDPERDTPDVLKNFVTFFNPQIVGLTGDQTALKKVWDAYGIYVAKDPAEKNSQGYAVEHTARVFLIDQEGNLKLTYPFGFENDRLTSDVRHLLGD